MKQWVIHWHLGGEYNISDLMLRDQLWLPDNIMALYVMGNRVT
jgi:hypothetical protein